MHSIWIVANMRLSSNVQRAHKCFMQRTNFFSQPSRAFFVSLDFVLCARSLSQTKTNYYSINSFKFFFWCFSFWSSFFWIFVVVFFSSNFFFVLIFFIFSIVQFAVVVVVFCWLYNLQYFFFVFKSKFSNFRFLCLSAHANGYTFIYKFVSLKCVSHMDKSRARCCCWNCRCFIQLLLLLNRRRWFWWFFGGCYHAHCLVILVAAIIFIAMIVNIRLSLCCCVNGRTFDFVKLETISNRRANL